MHRTLILLAAACACGKADRARSPAGAPAAPPPLARATQADLASDIADAERLGTWSDVAQRWRGQTVRWTVTHRGVLCRSADDCYVAASRSSARRSGAGCRSSSSRPASTTRWPARAAARTHARSPSRQR
jgi:hypothetical protein